MALRFFIIITGLFTFYSSSAGGGEYAVSLIPPSLLKKANVVKRMEHIHFEIINTGEAILKKKYALTILNENGARAAAFIEYYDKLHSIKNIEGNLYDAEGRELKKLKNKQVLDLTGSDDNNLADDNRRKAHHFYHRIYPYTVEYEVEIKYNGTLFFPVWMPREEEFFSVEQSRFTILAPAAYTVRYKAFNYPGEPVTAAADKGKKSISWQVSQLPAISDEFASPPWYEINPVVLTGPSEFEIEKYKGDMGSWKDFGQFVYALKKGRDELPPQVKQTVQQLVSGISDPKQKIAVLYNYLQKNTRYISIQLGIGGWQPFDASYVASKSYGDCKALANYMYSLLKEAGIPSVYSLVKAGRGGGNIIADFPAQQFNHVILSVPLQKDTVWLECTSQTLPAGYLGGHTDNRYALLVTEEGGILVRTPQYGLEENQQLRKINAVLEPEGALKLKAVTKYSGLQQDRYHSLIHNLSKERVKESLQEEFDFATYDISHFEYKEHRSSLPVIEEKLDILADHYATITGKRLFILPNIMTRHGRKLSTDAERKFDILLETAWRDVDTVEISLPAGYTAEAMPKDVSLQTPFGRYESAVRLQGDKLLYYRRMEQYSGRFPAGDYTELAKFYEAVYKSDRARVVLVKNE